MELAGRLATGLVHDFNNALLVALACLDAIARGARGSRRSSTTRRSKRPRR